MRHHRTDTDQPSHVDLGNVVARVISGVVLVPLGVACIYLGGWLFAAVVALICGVMAFEWHRMVAGRPHGTGVRVSLAYYGAVSLAVVVLTQAGQVVPALGLVAAATVLLPLLLGAVLAAAGQGPRAPLALYVHLLPGPRPVLPATAEGRALPWLLGGLGYFLVPAALVLWLRQDAEWGFTTVLWVLCVIWAYDTGAYAVGTLVGGPTFLAKVSPNKTWSGVAGGFCCAVLMGIVFETVRSGDAALRLAAFSGLLGLVGQAGDLFESGLKRHFGVKDSGGAIPGHGGVIDRMDSVVAAVSVTALMVIFLGGQDGLWTASAR